MNTPSSYIYKSEAANITASTPTIGKSNRDNSKANIRNESGHSHPQKPVDNEIHDLQQNVMTLEVLLQESVLKNDEQATLLLPLQETFVSNLPTKDVSTSNKVDSYSVSPIACVAKDAGDNGYRLQKNLYDVKYTLLCNGADEGTQPNVTHSSVGANISFSSQYTEETEEGEAANEIDYTTQSTTPSVDMNRIEKGTLEVADCSPDVDFGNCHCDLKKPIVMDNGSACSKVSYDTVII